MNKQLLIGTAEKLVGGNKGLLVMDQSTGTCSKRFASQGIAKTSAARRGDYRGMMDGVTANLAVAAAHRM